MSDNRLQEIITRAVVGRGERTLTWCHKIGAEEVKQVLGVRINKTDVECETDEYQPLVELTVDCDLWCSNGSDTKVIHTRCRCLKEVPVRISGQVLGDLQSHVMVVSGPRSMGTRVEGDAIYIDFEATVQAEMIGLSRLWIASYEMELSPCPDDWDLSLSSGDSGSPYGSH